MIVLFIIDTNALCNFLLENSSPKWWVSFYFFCEYRWKSVSSQSFCIRISLGKIHKSFNYKIISQTIVRNREIILNLLHYLATSFIDNYFFREQRKIPRQAQKPLQKLQRRKKVAAAERPKRRSGPREKPATNWTTWSCSTSPPTTNCWKKFQPTNLSHLRLWVKD